jgi:hypothetical protein
MKTITEQCSGFNLQTCFTCFEQGHTMDACTENKEDFQLVGPMAAFVAARLNYTVPECNAPRKYVGRDISTIKVSQHKEKFWYVRIYCRLADPGLVQQRWLEERPHEQPEEPPEEFKEKCFKSDAYHYRRCYLDMLRLIPERLHKRLIAQADYEELLHPTADDMALRIDEIEAHDLQNASPHDTLKYYRERYGVDTNVELKEKLRNLYGEPSLRESLVDV